MRRITASLALVMSLFLVGALAQQKRLMTFKDVINMRNVGDPQISPDGRRVAYTVTTADLKANTTDTDIWLVSTAGGQPVRLTTSKKNDNSPRWSPDGKTLAFVSAREERPQIFLISPFGGEAERLTDSKTGVQSFQWSPDGSRIAYVAQQAPTPDEEKRMKERDDAIIVDKNFKFARLWVIEVGSKKATELVKESFQLNDPQWSPDGRRIAFTVTPTPKADDGQKSDVYVVEAAGGSPRKLTDNEGPDTAPRWSPDGRQIAYLTRDLQGGLLGQLRLAVMSADGGGSRLVAPQFEYQPGAPTWSPDGRTLYFQAQTRTTSQLYAVPAAGGEARQLTNHAGVMSPATFSRDGSTLAFTRADLQTPADVHAAKLAAIGSATKLSDHNPKVRDLQLGRGEVIRWRGKDGMEIEGLLIYPVNYERGKRYPTVALIHGGPSGVWSQTFPATYGNYGHVWAGKGWAVFYPNVRGSSGYGEKFLLSNIRDWGGGDYQDIQTGLDDLIAKGIADADRLGQAGWSYGGYMTAWTITQTTRFKAAMVGAGLTNMFSMYSTNDIPRTLDGYFGAEPWDDPEAYHSRSAMTFIKRARTPTLILHGAEDKRVPIGQAQELYAGLLKNDVPVELVFYPRMGHGLTEPRHQLDKMRREYAWFSKYILGVEEAPPRADEPEDE